MLEPIRPTEIDILIHSYAKVTRLMAGVLFSYSETNKSNPL